jgi:hypothetical protein
MKTGELPIMIGKYIDLQSIKFIRTGIGFSADIFIISVDDSVLKLTKMGVEYFQVHEHNYDVDLFFFFRILSISLKNFLII